MEKNVNEFMDKIKEWEVQYGLEIVAENSLSPIRVLDRKAKRLYTSDGRIVENVDNVAKE